jgi:adenine-specific DNA-methyltransferase
MTETFKQHLENLLKKDTRLVDEQGELMGNKIKDLADKLDETFIGNLLEDEQSRKHFFLKIKEVCVFKAKEFKFYLEQNKLDNSFTNYANQIGLSFGGKYLKDNTDVVLNFPFKDCLLEGGQSTEEGLDTYFEYDETVTKADEKKGLVAEQYNEKQSKRKEIFFNEVIARDEIDRLLEPKAFTSITKFDAKGESIPTQFNRDAKLNKERGLPLDTITDNLIIKGNNLLALHSLKEEFKGKVKLIYIDPPYNTGNDSFSYNDNFNHSTWLIFMKNRLESAKLLMKSDGAIFISIDENELGYVKVLLDEIFGTNSQANLITIKRGSVTGHKSINPGVVNVTEYVIVFCKDREQWRPNKVYQPRSRNKRYNNYVLNRDGDVSEWGFCSLLDAFSDYKKIPKSKLKKEIGNSFEKEIFDFIKKNADSVIQYAYPDADKVSKDVKELIKKSKKESSKVFHHKRELEPDIYLINGQRMLFYSDRLKEIDGEIVTAEPLADYWGDVLPNDLHNEGGVKLKKGKKPEKLIKRILEISSNKNDIVLDFHIGSGTTAAVGLKMGRQFIGIEQLNYFENDSVNRLINTINGESSGISKSLNWKGGGSFIHLELAKNNQTAKEQIQECNSFKELLAFFEELYTKYFLHYNVRINEFKEVVSKEDNFKKLPLEKQKEIFCRMLDNNQLYVNASEMEDLRYKIDKEDIALTKDFYQKK